MNWFDLLLIAIVIVSFGWSLRQGFILELFYFLSFAGGLWVAFIFYPRVEQLLPELAAGEQVTRTFAFFALFVAVFLLLVIIGLICHNFVHFIRLGVLDRLFGGFLGLLRGLIIVAVVLIIVVAPQDSSPPDYLENSWLATPVVRLTGWSMGKLPSIFGQFYDDYVTPARSWVQERLEIREREN